MNLLTIIVLVVFALLALRGYRRGLVKSLASMTSLIVSLILVNIANPYVTEFLKTQTPVYEYILEKCEDAFTVKESAADDRSAGQGQTTEGSAQSKNSGTTQSKTVQEQMIDSLPLPQVIREVLKENNTPEYYRKVAAKSFNEYVPKYMAGLILSIVSFVATFVLVMSFIWLAVMTLDVIAGLPIIRGLNQMLGLILGMAQGIIIVWLSFLIITIFSHTEVGRQLMQMIAESEILTWIYDTNILLDFLQNTVQKLI